MNRKELRFRLKECPRDTIDRYYTQFKKTAKDVQLDIRTELIKIIKDYKQPASARVQAIREYNNLIEKVPETGEDPLLKLYQTVENNI